MARLSLLLSVVALFFGLRVAGFNFFEQMFQGGQQQQQQPVQNAPSDSEWYQKTYEGGAFASWRKDRP